MHELSLVADLVRKAEATAGAAGAQQVTALSVRLGALSHLSPEHLEEHLEHAARGSMLEGARLEVTVNPDPTDPRAQEVELLSVEVV